MQPKTITRTTWIAFSAALAATMMDLLDATIASVAGPVMRADLGGSYADLQWITAAYTLAMAVGLLTGGRLGDMFGRKRMLLIGVSGFTVASLLCAAAPSAELLIGSRALQGALGQEAGADEQDERADRQVDEEDRAPAGAEDVGVDQQAGHDRAEHRG